MEGDTFTATRTRIDAPVGVSSAVTSRRASRRGLKLSGMLGLCGAIAIVVAGTVSRMHEATKLADWTKVESIPTVAVVTPKPVLSSQPLVLPGVLDADYNAEIYSRVSGYVQNWYVDIGAAVKAGQVLATIDTPELDAQLIQARADLASAEANMQLARTTAKRWATLLAQDAVSQQESDEKAGDLAAKIAQVNAAQANVDRLEALKSFAKITAPFDGVVTARHTDIGALVNAGAAASPKSDLFDVAKINRLRLYVRVPQSYSARIRPGITAHLTVPEYPARKFKATLVSTSNAVNQNSGTVLVELMVNNKDHALQSGDYAQVTFDLPNTGTMPSLQLPASALVFRDQGMQVAVVGSSNRVQLHNVKIERDLGQAVDISAGLKRKDRVIDNPPDSIATGDQVRFARSAEGVGVADAAD